MTILDEIQSFFATNNLYDVINVKPDATDQQIKKAYRKASLLIHPDRVEESEKEEATKKFQVLAQVHYILSDPEKRKLYDDHGIIANDDGLDSEADWANYWRLLFPKVTQKDIESFLDKYEGSKEEEEDLIAVYERFRGDMDKIYQSHISYDEDKTTRLIEKLIEDGRIKSYDNFTKESQAKKERRKKRAAREAKEVEKSKKKLAEQAGVNVDNMDSLMGMIQRRSEQSFNSMIANLEAKYSKPKGKQSGRKVSGPQRGVKRKRQQDDEEIED